MKLNTPAERLRWLREQNHLSTAKLSAQLGMSQGNYQKKEQNHSAKGLSYEQMQKLHKLYNVSLNWIILGVKPIWLNKEK